MAMKKIRATSINAWLLSWRDDLWAAHAHGAPEVDPVCGQKLGKCITFLSVGVFDDVMPLGDADRGEDVAFEAWLDQYGRNAVAGEDHGSGSDDLALDLLIHGQALRHILFHARLVQQRVNPDIAEAGQVLFRAAVIEHV